MDSNHNKYCKSFLLECYKTKNNEIFVKYNDNITSDIITHIFKIIVNKKYLFENSNYFIFNIISNNDIKIINEYNTQIDITNVKNLILCNTFYDANILCKKTELIKTFEKYYFKNINILKESNNICLTKFNKIICLSDCYCVCPLNPAIHYFPIDKKILSIITNKYTFSILMDLFHLLKYYPKTYFNYNESLENKNYFLKYAHLDAQNGIFYGNKYFIRNVISTCNNNINHPLNNKPYIIQESVDNCLKFNGNRIIFGIWFYITKNNYYIYEKTCEIAVDRSENNKIYMKYNVLKDNDIKNFPIILKKMIHICKIILDKLVICLNLHDLSDKQFSLCRMDFLVEEDYKPCVLELNFNIDLNGRATFKDTIFTEHIVKDKFLSF